MLEQVVVFTRGGLVLWKYQFGKVDGSPVNDFIRNILIEERSILRHYLHDNYVVKWTLDNALGLVYVAVYQRVLDLTYVDNLLAAIKEAFGAMFAAQVRDQSMLHEYDFNAKYRELSAEAERSALQAAKGRVQRTFAEIQKAKAGGDKSEPASPAKGDETTSTPTSPIGDQAASPPADTKGSSGPSRKLLTKDQARKLGRGVPAPKSPPPSEPAPRGPKVPAARKRDDIRKEDMALLDYSDKDKADDGNIVVPDHLVDRAALARIKQETEAGAYEIPSIDVPDDEGEEEDVAASPRASTPNGTLSRSAAASPSKPAAPANSFFSFVQKWTGQKPLTEEDLAPAMAAMREMLVTKNVASDIADKLCQSVAANLIGKKPGTFKSIAAMVRESMEPALQRILTPKTSTDLLRDILATRQQQKRPYSMVFCGVNGVGKSTNLAKICFWLLQNKLRVLIAACDTFRSGAVEQLRVHVRNLRALDADIAGDANKASSIELYEKGYGKDAADISRDAISFAKANGFDVVMIDTAGRMQDNAPLMRALAKLVRINNPDKVIFVGEALVGNDGVDQLVKFNNALRDFADTADPRQIDGILLTKFDTIDDKVGAALSMTYITGQPIYFVGTGQTYTDLKKMNVNAVIKSLLH